MIPDFYDVVFASLLLFPGDGTLTDDYSDFGGAVFVHIFANIQILSIIEMLTTDSVAYYLNTMLEDPPLLLYFSQFTQALHLDITILINKTHLSFIKYKRKWLF